MNTQTPPLTPLIAAPELARRFGAILAGLAALVARRFLRMPHLVGLTVLLWTQLGRAARRFERAVTRVGKAGPARALVRKRAGRAALPQAVALPR
ncbi:MAG: hypothetical protein H7251_19775, partial [Acetobacteraceae bacterium]|nr:hypothetical protein [Acetobacteraceae bacterium]